MPVNNSCLLPTISSALLVLLLCLFQNASADTPETINAMLLEGDYDTALVAVEKALAEKPENDRLKLQKGFILIKLRKLDEAEQFYNELVQQQPDNPEPMNNLGVIFQLKKEYRRAIDQLNATIEQFPDFVRAYENLGDTYMQMATQSYLAGRTVANTDPMLISKVDLGQRFYALANANQEPAIKRFAAEQGTDTTADEAPSTSSPGVPPASIGGDQLAGVEQEIADFLRSWVVTWSGQKIDEYLAHYASDFTPSGGVSIATWKDRKQRVINNAKFINIRIEDIKIIEQSDDQITLTFNQNYESDSYQEETAKTMTLKRYDGDWKIIAEE